MPTPKGATKAVKRREAAGEAMLTTDDAKWVEYQLSQQAADLRKRAVALRSQGRRHLPLKNAAQTAAEAIDRAAIELERASKQVHQQQGVTT